MVRTKQLTRWDERRTLAMLDRLVEGTGFRVFAKLRLKDVIGPERGEELSRDDRRFWMTSHLDFVLYERAGYLSPVLAVEFDGPQHDDEPQITRDIRKNRLCAEAKLPLLRIRGPDLDQYDQTSLFEFMISRFLLWKREHRKLKTEIATYLRSLDESELESLVGDGIADPSIDPSFLFNLSHPFPGIHRVASRLIRDHGILTPYAPAGCGRNEWALACDTVCVREESASIFESGKVVAYSVYRRGEGGVPRHALCEGEARFGIQWAMPVVHDYDPAEAPASYLIRTGAMPLTFVSLPGVHAPDIAEWFSEYLALRAVEAWAKQREDRPGTRGGAR